MILLSDDFSEQLESVPIKMVSFSFRYSETKFTKSLTHSRNSESLPLVGKYTEIAINFSFSDIILRLENLSFVVFNVVIFESRLACHIMADPCQEWSMLLSRSSGGVNMSGVKQESGQVDGRSCFF